MNKYPKIDSVKVHSDKHLLVTFRNSIQKLYDCKPLLVLEPFEPLRDDVLFKMVKVDRGGYGVSWNDEIDLSESELWLASHPRPIQSYSSPMISPTSQNHASRDFPLPSSTIQAKHAYLLTS